MDLSKPVFLVVGIFLFCNSLYRFWQSKKHCGVPLQNPAGWVDMALALLAWAAYLDNVSLLALFVVLAIVTFLAERRFAKPSA